MSSLDSDSRGDNRCYDYNTTYTKIDITSDVINATTENVLYTARKGLVFSTEQYSKDDLFFQLDDINSKLAMEGEIKFDYYNGAYYTYTLRDKNYDELHDRITDEFDTDKIHDATDSTCIVKTVLDNVAHANGRLLLVNADSESSTYSPVLRNYPLYKFLRDLSDITDSCFIIEPSGKTDLDDDKASGDSYDVDTDKIFLAPPKIVSIQESINYYEIYGAINPDTGQRLYKIVDNSGTDEPRKCRTTKNTLLNQTDVDAYATAVSSKVVDINQYTFTLQGIGTHDMGETMTMVYDLTNYSIDDTYYIISEKMNYDTAVSTIVLSEGLLEKSAFAQRYEEAYEEVNTIASEIYETDINTVYPSMHPLSTTAYGTGAGGDVGFVINAIGEEVIFHFYLADYLDPSRDVIITITYTRDDANSDAFNYWFTVNRMPCDASQSDPTAVTSGAVGCDAADQGEGEKYQYTLSSANVVADNDYYVVFWRNDARDITVRTCTVRYYVKRALS